MEHDSLISDLRGQRTLAAVVFTDGVGFSARMCADEDRALDLIRQDLKRMRSICNKFEGRVLKSTGDGLLMYFASAVKAVECAVEIQRVLAEAAAEMPAGDALKHRIGIHLGDMFITETDVMGNGVNIAARLQAEAEPGGICISQTVYDVVKGCLHLETTALGPRELKNISEVIPVYKVRLPFQPADEYDQVCQRLEQDPNLLRIKKLLLYLGKNRWENDSSRLANLRLRELLQDIRKQVPSLARLESLLDSTVSTLSKQAEYQVVAQTLVQEFSLLYTAADDAGPAPEADMATGIFQPSQMTFFTQPAGDRATTIAQALAKVDQRNRITRLLYYACHNRWETDPARLGSANLADLVRQLRQQQPSLSQLRSLLDSLVQTLSKPAEYGRLAETILEQMTDLYNGHDQTVVVDGDSDNTSLMTTVEAIPQPSVTHVLEQSPQRQRIKKLLFYLCRRSWPSDTAQLEQVRMGDLVQQLPQQYATLAELRAAIERLVKTLSKPAEYGTIAQLILSQMERLYTEPPADQPPVTQPSTPEPLPTAPPALADLVAGESPVATALSTPTQDEDATWWFDLRLELMKYANPLRIKILLFSVLHHSFEATYQDWFQLKLYDLTALLRNLPTVCPTLAEFETRAQTTARTLAEPDDYLQTAVAVVKCLRPHYQRLHQPLLALEMAGEPTQLTTGLATGSEGTRLEAGGESTQFLAASDIQSAADPFAEQTVPFSPAPVAPQSAPVTPPTVPPTSDMTSSQLEASGTA